jgi:hypothetical protein
MKTNNIFRLLTLALAAMAFAFVTSCEGPAGPAGPAGADGTNGADGAPGQDINETCKQCHNSNTEIIGAQQAQFAYSAHAGGTYYNRTGQCAACHNNEGFRARASYTDEWTEADAFTGALTQISCYTCHMVHETYTLDDWGLTYVTPVTATLFGFESDAYAQGSFVDNGNSNMCMQCHQSRDPGLVPAADATGTISITNKRWGPHHGPQGNVSNSLAGVRIAGNASYPAEGNGHTGSISGTITCVECHFGENKDHALGFADNYGTKVFANYAACVQCHTDEDTAEGLHEALAAEVQGKIDALQALLLDQGILDGSDYVAVPIDLSADQAKALWNYKLAVEDKSLGLHAPTYMKALLDNSIALITP